MRPQGAAKGVPGGLEHGDLPGKTRSDLVSPNRDHVHREDSQQHSEAPRPHVHLHARRKRFYVRYAERPHSLPVARHSQGKFALRLEPLQTWRERMDMVWETE